MCSEKTKSTPDKLGSIFAERMASAIYASKDPFTFIIKGHLYVEALINVIIECGFFKSERLELDRSQYGTKTTLAVAAGLIHDEVLPVLQKLGSIRNCYGHNMWFAFTVKEETDFLNVLKQSADLRERFVSYEMNNSNNAQHGIYVLCTYLFEQVLRVSSNKKLLSEFLKNTVDSTFNDDLSVNVSRLFGSLKEKDIDQLK